MEKAIREVISMSKEALIVLLAIFIIIRVAMYFSSDSRRFSIHEEILNLLFLAYLLILALLVTSSGLSDFGGTNFIPFKEILRYDIGTVGFNRQVIGNVLLFIPFGFFVSKYGNIKNLGVITITSLLSSLTIEVVQYFFIENRSFDVDDIILNIVGGIIGFLVYISLNAIKNHMPKFLRKDWFYNLLSILVIVLIVLFVIKIM